ncbi:RNA methyltransferase [Daejeonella sp. H1SJ63]|jgi:TrmH family RNA methyltransferase|uniref:TrmH family RNA methyltransferase n=1 Tax=Daejeonella sp. H1SJ63 TaxID=3034145 RepID=UPI0023EB193D|nr:RNA methyltransferase [Daejeonella sp. H1SJ63]
MISKSQISFIKSLHQKKFRKEHGLFIVEGLKSFSEFIGSGYEIDSVFHTEDLSPKLSKLSQNVKIYRVSTEELSKISALNTPQHLLAIIKIPENPEIKPENLKGTFHIVIDGIQDPGNLGTIIRTADWFGFKYIICSQDTVEVYNPKVVQATMGSLPRVKLIYTDLINFFAGTDLPVFGALLDGNSIYKTDFGNEGLILLGNEGKGISTGLMSKITVPVTIPRFGKAESLNVAVSASIFCSEIRRNS